MIVCSCNVLSDRQIRSTIQEDGTGPRTLSEAYGCLGCSPNCGRCAATVLSILREARSVCASHCHSCVSKDVDCAVHVHSSHGDRHGGRHAAANEDIAA